MSHLTVLFDQTCGFCVTCAQWLDNQTQLAQLELLPMGSPQVTQRWPGLRITSDELVAIGDNGAVYRGDAGFIACLWALEDYREWSLRLSSPALRSLARKGFELVSKRRHGISEWLKIKSDGDLAAHLNLVVGSGTPRCAALPTAKAGG